MSWDRRHCTYYYHYRKFSCGRRMKYAHSLARIGDTKNYYYYRKLHLAEERMRPQFPCVWVPKWVEATKWR